MPKAKMIERTNNIEKALVAVEVSSHLFKAKEIAEHIAFSSRNLIILSFRIGDSAAGLAVLAEFYNRCSKECIYLAEQIASIALNSSLQSVAQWRKDLFNQKIKQVFQSIESERLPDSLVKLNERLQNNEEAILKDMESLNKQLFSFINDFQRNIRTISTVVVNARIEAPNAGDEGDILEKLADEVKVMTETLRLHIKKAIECMV